MLIEVEGQAGNTKFLTKYKLSGKELLEILESKGKEESLIDALAKRVEKKPSEVALFGSTEKKISKDSVISSQKNSCFETSKEQWFPCERCWTKIIRSTFQLRGSCCLVCGSKEKIGVHHIIPRSENGSNDCHNLMPLCSKCHDFIECHKEKPRTLEACLRVGILNI